MHLIRWTPIFQIISTLTVVRTSEPPSYAPTSVHVGETSYIDARLSQMSREWKTWLGDGSQLGYDLETFEGFTIHPTLGISLSGGGGRAALYGAGVLEALDGRNASSVSTGTGGMLQVASYVAGLSGGSWLTTSLTFNNYPEIRSLVLGDSERSGWMLDLDLIAPGGFNVFGAKNQQYYSSAFYGVTQKENAGFHTSIADVWSRFLSYHFLAQNYTSREDFFSTATKHGAGLLWSHIPQLQSFRNHSIPFPIIVADSRPSWAHSAGVQSLDSPVFEITPFEMGSYDPSLSAMADITYAGTQFIDGQPANSTACVTGFDQAGFVIGTSSIPFNAIMDIARQRMAHFDPVAISAVTLWNLVKSRLSKAVDGRRLDVARWPNPFRTNAPTSFRDYNTSWLELIDGSLNEANIPLGPLFLKARNLDVIVVVDSSSNREDDFVNGNSLLSTATRLKYLLAVTHRQFPPIPENIRGMMDTGVVLRPTFFGCYPTQDIPEWPLLIYLPNSPPINGQNPVTNPGTFKSSFTPKHTSIFLDQVHNLTVSGFTPGLQVPDSSFGRCLQCAAIDRARYKLTPVVAQSDFCSLCFERYCYDPERPPSARDVVGRVFDYKDPDPQALALLLTYLADHRRSLVWGTALGLGILLVLAIFLYIRSNQKTRRAQEWAHYDALRDDIDDEDTYYLEDLSPLDRLPDRDLLWSPSGHGSSDSLATLFP